MKLKCKKKTVIEVDCFDLERFINEVYGHNFEILCDLECANDSCRTMSIKKGKMTKYDLADVGKYKEIGEGSYLLHQLMDDMCARDLIEEGDYVIEISW